MRVALVHDRLVSFRGGESVFAQMCEALPDADSYALISDSSTMPKSRRWLIERSRTPALTRNLPARGKLFRWYAPLYPLAALSLDLAGYDVIVCSSSAFAHWVRLPRAAKTLCYLYTPLRQAWSEADLTRTRLPVVIRPLYSAATAAFRRLDRRAAVRFRHIGTSSEAMRRRILAAYGVDSFVIPPPADLVRFQNVHSYRDDDEYFLVVSALVPYKRIDIAVEACSQLGLRLKVVGVGPEESRLKRLAGATVEFLGGVGDEEVVDLYARCRAFLFPTIDDYGITCIEAQASGRPVFAARGGGALETVVEGTTGEFFWPQSTSALVQLLTHFDASRYDPKTIRRNAERFGVEGFREAFRSWVATA